MLRTVKKVSKAIHSNSVCNRILVRHIRTDKQQKNNNFLPKYFVCVISLIYISIKKNSSWWQVAKVISKKKLHLWGISFRRYVLFCFCFCFFFFFFFSWVDPVGGSGVVFLMVLEKGSRREGEWKGEEQSERRTESVRERNCERVARRGGWCCVHVPTSLCTKRSRNIYALRRSRARSYLRSLVPAPNPYFSLALSCFLPHTFTHINSLTRGYDYGQKQIDYLDIRWAGVEHQLSLHPETPCYIYRWIVWVP